MKNSVNAILVYSLYILCIPFFVSSACISNKLKSFTSHQIDSSPYNLSYINIIPIKFTHKKEGTYHITPMAINCLYNEFYGDNFDRLFTIARLQHSRKKSLRGSKATYHLSIFQLYQQYQKIITGKLPAVQLDVYRWMGARAPPVILAYRIFYRKAIHKSIRFLHPDITNLVCSSIHLPFYKFHQINNRNNV